MRRRQFLAFSVSALAAPAVLVRPARAWTYGERILHMWNPRTEEVYHRVYHNGRDFVPDALEQFSWFARDWRRSESVGMDTETMDFLSLIQDEFGHDIPFHLLSGYRSPATNAMLARQQSGVARESWHMKGRALDIRHSELSVSDLADFARDAHQGGVGVYSQNNFIHIDSATFRTWGS